MKNQYWLSVKFHRYANPAHVQQTSRTKSMSFSQSRHWECSCDQLRSTFRFKYIIVTLVNINAYIHHRILKKNNVTWSNCTAACSTLPYTLCWQRVKQLLWWVLCGLKMSIVLHVTGGFLHKLMMYGGAHQVYICVNIVQRDSTSDSPNLRKPSKVIP